jgi:hypothetical protein
MALPRHCAFQHHAAIVAVPNQGETSMAFEAIKAEIRKLLEETIDEPQDLRELHLQLLEKLNQMRATGMPLPDDLVELERQLTANFDQLPEE